MASSFGDSRDWDEVAANAFVQNVLLRASGFEAYGVAAAGRRAALSEWTGPGSRAAGAALDQDQAYVDAARSAAAELAARLGRVVDGRTRLKHEISNIVEDGAQLRFTIGDDGTVNDFYGQTGLWTELSGAQKALYLKLKAELPERVVAAITTGDSLDDEAAAAFREAVGPEAPAALGDQAVLTSDQEQGMVYVNTGDGDSTISVTQDAHGWVTITVNGESHELAGHQAQSIEIDSGKGNDTITVSPDVTVRVRLVDAGGDNTIDDEAVGGSYVETGDGNNKVTLGGGHNYVYLGSGTNTVTGSNGADYINGGSGNNTINAGKGNSVLYGGTGKSTINAGTGKDVIYTGSGDVTVNNQGGQDQVYAQAASHVNDGPGENTVVTVTTTNIPDSVTVSGTPEFRERVLADLQLIASSPTGQHMLDGIGHSGHTLTISDGSTWNDNDPGHEVRNNSFTWVADGHGDPLQDDPKTEYADPTTGHHGQGHDVVIAFDPTLTDLLDDTGTLHPAQGSEPDYHDRAPVVGLYHELAHAYDFTNGTMAPGSYGPNGTDRVDAQLVSVSEYLRNAEREAVGLPINWDGDAGTPETLVPEGVHPHDLTENALRDEMGEPDREHYLG